VSSIYVGVKYLSTVLFFDNFSLFFMKMNSTPKQYQPFMMAEERAARSVFGKLIDHLDHLQWAQLHMLHLLLALYLWFLQCDTTSVLILGRNLARFGSIRRKKKILKM